MWYVLAALAAVFILSRPRYTEEQIRGWVAAGKLTAKDGLVLSLNLQGLPANAEALAAAQAKVRGL